MANVINIGGGAGGGGGDASKQELTWAEYQALTEAEKNNGTMYFCNDVNGDGSEFQPVIYSEEEREIGVWKDGKPLYQKTVDCGTLPNASDIHIAHNISNLADVVCVFGCAINSSYTSIPLPYPDTVVQYNVNVSVDTTYVNISTGRDRTQFTGYITIQYTKTTDQAGSGTWTPQGVPAQHYSTDEQVVGTWIDGNTIYEKTIAISESSFAVGWKWFTTNLICDYLIDTEVWLKDSVTTYCYTNLPVAIRYSDGSIGICNNMGGTMGSVTGYVTVRYTKTTT